MEDDTWIGLIATSPALKKDKSDSEIGTRLNRPALQQR